MREFDIHALASDMLAGAEVLEARARALREAAAILVPAPDQSAEPAPRSRPPRPGPTLEQVRDACRSLGDFNQSEVARHLGRYDQRTIVRQRVLQLEEMGLVARRGGERGSTVRYRWDSKRKGQDPTHKPRGEVLILPTSRRADGQTVPLTGKAKGPSGRPGYDKARQNAGHRVVKGKAKGRS